jgi:hypothetical protein
MGNGSKTERTKKNVARIAWVIIAIHALGVYQIMNSGERHDFFTYSNKIASAIGLSNMFGYPFWLNVVVFVSMVMGIALIYFAARMLQFNEKGRKVLSILIIVDVIVMIATFVFSVAYMFPFGLNLSLVMILLKAVIYNGAMITMYVLFYRFLNKPETKCVFIEEDLNS